MLGKSFARIWRKVWILRHPARIQPMTGTENPQHLREIAKAAEITMTRPEWYELYLSAGRKLP